MPDPAAISLVRPTHFKNEIWNPLISERRSYEEWEAGGKKSLSKVIDEKVVEILDQHQVPSLAPKVLAKLDEIVAREEDYLASR